MVHPTNRSQHIHLLSETESYVVKTPTAQAKSIFCILQFASEPHRAIGYHLPNVCV